MPIGALESAAACTGRRVPDTRPCARARVPPPHAAPLRVGARLSRSVLRRAGARRGAAARPLDARGQYGHAAGASRGRSRRPAGTLFAQHATAPRIPASVEKLFTTATALRRFGADARIATRVVRVRRGRPDGVLRRRPLPRRRRRPDARRTPGSGALARARSRGAGITARSSGVGPAATSRASTRCAAARGPAAPTTATSAACSAR